MKRFGAARRTIRFEPTSCTIVLGGWSKFAAFARRIKINYRDIESVTIESGPKLSLMTPRIGWLNPVTGARAGRFRPKGHHMFVSYDRATHRLLCIRRTTSDVTEFDTIYVEIDNVDSVLANFKQKLR